MISTNNFQGLLETDWGARLPVLDSTYNQLGWREGLKDRSHIYNLIELLKRASEDNKELHNALANKCRTYCLGMHQKSPRDIYMAGMIFKDVVPFKQYPVICNDNNGGFLPEYVVESLKWESPDFARIFKGESLMESTLFPAPLGEKLRYCANMPFQMKK
jgi:hypothetical protein